MWEHERGGGSDTTLRSAKKRDVTAGHRDGAGRAAGALLARAGRMV